MFDRSFNAASETDLFDGLERAVKEHQTLSSNLTVTQIFSSWSRQPGYPLLTVNRVKSDQLTIAQTRYLGGDTDRDGRNTTTWWVPYNYATSKTSNFSDTRPIGWLTPNDTHKTINVSLSATDWIIFNKQQTSLYRVLYDTRNYQVIAKQLNSNDYAAIHVLNRANLLDDLNAFFRDGFTTADILLDFIPYLRRETEYAPWVPGRAALQRFNQLLSGSERYQEFRWLGANVTKQFFNKYGLDEEDGEPVINTFARTIASTLACDFREPDCLRATHDKLFKSLQENTSLSIDIRATVYRDGARTASESELELLWNRLFNGSDRSVTDLIPPAFGRIEDTNVLEKFLQRIIQSYQKEPITASWRETILTNAIANGPDSLRVVIRFIHKASNELKEILKYKKFETFILDISQIFLPTDLRSEVSSEYFYEMNIYTYNI